MCVGRGGGGGSRRALNGWFYGCTGRSVMMDGFFFRVCGWFGSRTGSSVMMGGSFTLYGLSITLLKTL